MKTRHFPSAEHHEVHDDLTPAQMGTEHRPASAGLPLVRAADLPRMSSANRWLIEGLWAHQGVGLVAAAPKSGKTWTCMDLAVSVATGTPAFGAYPVPSSSVGPVLAYFAEDALPLQRERLEFISTARGVQLRDAPLHMITAAELRLDRQRHQQLLLDTLDALEPRLLVLDCLVRLHSLPENDASAMSSLLGWIRTEINRRRGVAVVVAHHATKKGGTGGASMRGSGDLHAWGDSNVYLRRQGKAISMRIEHRSAPSPDPVQLTLVEGDAPHLRVSEESEIEDQLGLGRDLEQEALVALRELGPRATYGTLRETLGINNGRVGEILRALEERGLVHRAGRRWVLAAGGTVPPSPKGDER